jgi:hypothetical protein
MSAFDSCRAGEHEWVPYKDSSGTDVYKQDVCKRCRLLREQTGQGVSYTLPTPWRLVEHEQTGDARAQLWARVYAAEFSACRHGTLIDSAESLRTANDTLAMKRARSLADAAVRDFDEHYLGGKR